MQDFAKLKVWHDSQELAVGIYSATKAFPASERYGLASQMRRAAISISSNIAEGCGRDGPAEFGRFLQIAIGSTCELLSQVEVSEKLGLLEQPVSTALKDTVDLTRRKLIKLREQVETRRGNK